MAQENIENLLKKYALLNAVSHDGKASVGAVVGRVMAERKELRTQSGEISKLSSKVVTDVNSLSLEAQIQILHSDFPETLESETQRKKEQSKKDSERKYELPPLPNAKVGQVVTRFPPEPNGFMHIGHAKAAIIGSEYAKLYNGKFIMRFDDTNPSAEKKEYYDAFLDSFAWLQIKPDIIRNSSDDMDKYYAIVEKMILSKNAYVCNCSRERMKELRGQGIGCEHRSRPASESLELWRKMISKELTKSDATLRFMGDITSVNTAMRDPVLFRIIEDPHPLLEKKYIVWPTYDFAGPIEDSLDGVTHAMRSKEYELRDEVYHAILRSIGMRDPEMIDFARLNFQNTTVHKRTLRPLINDKLVEGWDDPRLPTVSALRRRGFLPEAIREFILSMGVSKVESEPTFDLLESINRKLLDPISKRYFFVPEPIELKVENAPGIEVRLKYHPDQTDNRERIIKLDDTFVIPKSDSNGLKQGSKLRLIEAYNVEIIHNQEGVLQGKYAGEEVLPEAKKVQWVSKSSGIQFKVKVPGPLLLNDEFNPKSLETVEGLAEESVGQIPIGEIVQFVRFGFCRIDSNGIAIRTHK